MDNKKNNKENENIKVKGITPLNTLDLTEEEREAEIKAAHKRRRVKTAVFAGVVAVIAAGAIAFPNLIKNIMANSNKSDVQADMKVLSETVKNTKVTQNLMSAGSLEGGNSKDISTAGKLDIDKYFVENGDIVKAGDKIALVDKTSAMKVIREIQDKMDSLDAKLGKIKSGSNKNKIKATTDLRVKAVYVKKGSDAADTIKDKGALIRCSLDGLMACDIDRTDDTFAGKIVKVRLSDGTVLGGKIVTVNDTKATCTIPDKKAMIDDAVTVSDTDGKVLGTSKLYIHCELPIITYSGKVDDIKVKVNEKVDKGETLVTLTGTKYTGEYNSLVYKRSVLEDQMKELFEIYNTGYIVAECDGKITGIEDDTDDDEDENDSADVSAEAEVKADVKADSNKGAEDKAADADAGAKIETAESAGSDDKEAEPVAKNSYAFTGKPGSGIILRKNPPADVDDSSFVNYAYVVYKVGYNGMIVKGTGSPAGNVDYQNIASIDTRMFKKSSVVKLEPDTAVYTYDKNKFKVATAENTVFEADDIIVLTYSQEGKLLWVVKAEPVEVPEGGKTKVSPTPAIPGGMDLSKVDPSKIDTSKIDTSKIDTSKLPPELAKILGGGTGTNKAAANANDAMKKAMEAAAEAAAQAASKAAAQAAAQAAAYAKTMGMGGAGDLGDAQAQSEAEDEFKMEETVIATIVNQDTMHVDVNIDELDISEIEIGMEMDVTIDALSGQSFKGKITKVNTDGKVNESGNTKYTITVTLDKTDDMLEGMNATVSRVIKSEELLCLPVEAVCEENNEVFCYTAYDQKKDELTGKVVVKTGMSDGKSVQIVEGLKEGDTVHYKYAGGLLYSFKNGN